MFLFSARSWSAGLVLGSTSLGWPPNPCRRNSERGRNGARRPPSELWISEALSEVSQTERTGGDVPFHPRSRHGCRASQPGLHRICRFATLVPSVVSKCAATPGMSHAGLHARAPRTFVISLATANGEIALTLILWTLKPGPTMWELCNELEGHWSFLFLLAS